MTHRRSSFHHFQPSRNALGPCTMVWLHVLEVSQVPSGRGNHGAPGHTWDFSLTLRFPSKAAGPAHAPKGSLHPCSFEEARAGRCPWAGGGSGVRWQGHQGLRIAEKVIGLIPSSVRSEVVGRTEMFTKHVSTQRYCPPLGIPKRGRGVPLPERSASCFRRGLFGATSIYT